MSGHSKWQTIKHQKSANDAKRGNLFSKLTKEIAVSVKEGGSAEPENNPRLRLIIEKARAANMPKENIQRAIDKGAGKEEGGRLETIVFEGFGPEDFSVLVECVTDNKNRCSQEVKTFFDKKGGRLGSSGSVGYLFDRKGYILVKKEEGDEEEQVLKLIDAGAEDFESKSAGFEVYVQPDKLHQTVEDIKKIGFTVLGAELVLKPKMVKKIDNETTREKIRNFLEGLDTLEDVQRIVCDVDVDI